MNTNFKKDIITALTDATSGYKFQIALETALHKERLDALDYEPILDEMAKENTLQGQVFNLPLYELASMINIHFGNLCYRAYYKEEGISKTHTEYSILWGELVTVLAARAEKAEDYICLGSCVQIQFVAFEFRAEAIQFANENYDYAIEAMDSVENLIDFVGGHLCEEYYENDELRSKAGQKSLELASTFQEFAYICFDANENCRFYETDIYKNAAIKAVELKAQASVDEINHFKSMLVEWEDQETLKLL
jgi:hypothetical protein